MAILGIDEVGRGPLAGPLVIGAVVLPRESSGELPEWTAELRDSKKLSSKKREALNVLIREKAVFGLGWVFSDELDELGMTEALKLATRRAVEEVQKKAKDGEGSFSQIVIDGKINFLSGTRLEKYVSTVVKADDLVKEVSAASIVAKVARDKYMVELSGKYPGYGFEKHVGYGTAAHMAAIRELGVCPEHRKSFEPIKSMVGFERPGAGVGSAGAGAGVGVVKNTTLAGKRGEEVVADFLKKNGHEIVARNFKTKMCEIDIVSVLDDKLYFTEVKYRKNNSHGGGLAAIDNKKLEKMQFAVDVFLKARPEFYNREPLLAAASVSGPEFALDEWFSI